MMVVTKGTGKQDQRSGGLSHRTVAWLAWSLWTGCVAFIVLALLLDFSTDDSLTRGILVGQIPGPAFAVLTGVLSLAFPAVGALIASRLPTNPVGWIFCGVGLLYTTQRFTQAYADYALLENLALPGGEYVAWFSGLVEFSGLILSGVLVMLLFPEGRLMSRQWRIVAWMAVFGAVLIELCDAFYPEDLPATAASVENPFGVMAYIGGGFTTDEVFIASAVLGETLLLTSSLAALFSLFVRLHRARGDERQQLKWFLYAAVPAGLSFSFVLLSFIVVDFTDLYLFSTPLMELRELILTELILPWGNYSDIYDGIYYAGAFATLSLPVFTYIAILRYHLFDIDIVINRTLVYVSLSACVVVIYVLAVVGFGALFQIQGNLGVSLLATGLVAVLFQPLRMRLQRGVNRLMYGERDDPYAVISRLGRRLEATLAPEAVLPTVVETIAQALKLPYAAILLKDDNEMSLAILPTSNTRVCLPYSIG